MPKPCLLFAIVLLFTALASRAQEQFRYPYAAPPLLSFERTASNELHFSVNTHTNVIVELLQSDSMLGPWDSTSWSQPIASHNAFFKARVNLQNIRSGPYNVVSPTMLAVRMTDTPPPDFTTTNG